MSLCLNLYEIKCYMVFSCDVGSICAICDVNDEVVISMIFLIYCVFFVKQTCINPLYMNFKKTGINLFTAANVSLVIVNKGFPGPTGRK
jgi:hypothetical protein